MNAEQEKIANDAIEKLNEIRSKIASGVGDVNSLTQQYNDVLMEVKSGLHEVLDNLPEKQMDYWQQNNTANIREFPPCGTLARQPKYGAGSQVVGAGVIKDIQKEIQENPIDYSELQEMNADAQAGRGAGQENVRIRVRDIGLPSWVNELETELKLFKKRRRTKGGMDPEDAARGFIHKEKMKKNMKNKTLWIALDCSGSMFSLTSRGTLVIELVANYIVPIASKFQGELWEVDDGIPSKIIQLKDLTKATIQGIPIQGQGGTNFDEVWRLIAKKKEEISEKQGDKAEFMTILLTDAIVNWNYDIMPDNLMIVAPAESISNLPTLDEERNQKAILIEG